MYKMKTILRRIREKKMWWLGRKGPSGFSASSTAEEVTQGIDATDFTAIVTGATSGIGAETARVLALRGVHVVMGIRNMAAGGEIKETIQRDNPSAKIDMMELDLSSLESVRKFAAQFKSCGLPLNILVYVILLSYVLFEWKFWLSKDNIELQFATNHGNLRYNAPFAGHFLLTNLLLETMKQTAIEQRKEGRIVNVSSRRHKLSYPEGIRFDKINDESGYNSFSAYGQSKLANVLHANELARRLKEEGTEVTANSVSPGPIATSLFRHHSLIDVFVGLLGKYVMKNIQQGAATTCYVALHPQIKGLSGRYFADSNLAEASSQAVDPELARKLYLIMLQFHLANGLCDAQDEVAGGRRCDVRQRRWWCLVRGGRDCSCLKEHGSSHPREEGMGENLVPWPVTTPAATSVTGAALARRLVVVGDGGVRELGIRTSMDCFFSEDTLALGFGAWMMKWDRGNRIPNFLLKSLGPGFLGGHR
ncbi:hypothetical protein V8G54_011689 [Vigna mungo]|uniref:Short-chain dehydrogenase TIC 32, chloroplastic n=1 Tax=Vigna mungo TaxID=3915 RepID=A0AAQ3NTD0_VIGMU